MDLKEIAMPLWPCWMLGIIMLCTVFNSKHRDLIRVDAMGVLKFLRWMVMLTAIRFVFLKFLAPESMIEQVKFMVHFLPWQATLGVFWEDACHTLPLVLLGRIFQKSKWYSRAATPLMLGVMLSFGSGHMYQGLLASVALAFYIPFSIKLGKKYGFGTVMICHILFDLITLLSFKAIVGA